ncbi:hypothetical protein GCM10011583_28250 [Streptomyces camponoticapitis]|uniref:Integral membrane protein n=1 Tax=Streptomyces camponoticapitis TaxID=1616125 RepID=A0ABQ2E5Q7_9ACTN|nr:DUF6185 family protein [Streptomyces camponoticapitis]GGJ95077.1 hypothetical protein GCM10011583_28250 [Streptomyces camponoticapitis]
MRRALLLFVFTGLLALSSFGAVGKASAASPQAEDSCLSGQLKTARVTTSVRLKHDGEDYTKAETDLVVQVPKTWKLARSLLLNGDTERYRSAMRCVLRYPDDPYPYRDTEARPWPPEVTVEAKWITVRQRAVTYVYDRRDRDFGPWRITVGKRFWTLALVRPPALDKAWWREITVDLGGRAARTMSPTPTKGSTTRLTWVRAKAGGEPPEVRIAVQPPAMKALITGWGEKPWYLVPSVTWLTWELAVFPVMLVLVRRLRRTPASPPRTPADEAAPASSRETADERTARRDLLLWAYVAFAVALVYEVDDMAPSLAGDYGVLDWWPEYRTAIHFGLAACGGAAFCLFGLYGFFGRLRIAALSAVLVATAYPVVMASAPHWFGLPAGFWLDENDIADIERLRYTGGFLWLALACCCVAFVWLVGTASAVRRLRARPGELPGRPRQGRSLRWLLVLCAITAVAIVALAVWAKQNSWEQEAWLSIGPGDEFYDRWHLAHLYNSMAWFPSDWPDTFSVWAAWLIRNGILLAVLAARSNAPGASPVSPPLPEKLILTVLFLTSVVPIPGWYVGVPASLLDLPLIVLAGFLLLGLGRRRSVLSQELPAGTPLREVIRESDRPWLIDSARKYRDLHLQLRRWEQGDQEGERIGLETRLDDLHRWNPDDTTSPHAGKALPDSVDAIELILAWGPRDTWFSNACRAAFFAAVIALPATAISFWANHVRGPLWGNVPRDQFGVVTLVQSVIGSEVIWAAAGFVLGALWRVLPGRRGPAKALGLSLVYATPVGLYWIISRAVEQPSGTWALDVALTLLVLTTTGVAMDIDTFRNEGHYWPTKAALLLSIYQLRTASVQLAFFVAQVVALVGVWQQLKGNDPMVLIEPQSPTGTQGGPSTGDSP